MLFHAHSGLRYLILFLGVVALAMMLMGLFGRRPYDRSARIPLTLFAVTMDVQLVLGLLMITGGRFYDALIGHLVMMFAAIGVAHAASVMARRRASDARRAYTIGAAGAALSLVLIVGGIMAIGRGVFQSTSGGAQPAAVEAAPGA